MAEGTSHQDGHEFGNITISQDFKDARVGIQHADQSGARIASNDVDQSEAHIGAHVEGGGINIAIEESTSHPVRADAADARPLAVKAEKKKLEDIYPTPVDFDFEGRKYDARSVFKGRDEAERYLALKGKPQDKLTLEDSTFLSTVKGMMRFAIESGAVSEITAKGDKGTKIDKEPKTNEYKLTEAELVFAIARLRQAFPLSGGREPTDIQIEAIVEQEIGKRGDKAPIPKEAKVFTIAQIKEAYKKPEVAGKRYKFSEGEFMYIFTVIESMHLKSADQITDELIARIKIPPEISKDRKGEVTINLEGIRALVFPEKEDKDIKFELTDAEYRLVAMELKIAQRKDELTPGNIEAKVRAAIDKITDGGKRVRSKDAKTMTKTLADFKKELDMEKKEDKGPIFILTDQEFGFIVENVLKTDTTITAANVEMKVRDAVNKSIADYKKRSSPAAIQDAKEYTLSDFKKALGIVENEPSQGHVLTEGEFVWIVQEMLKPGSGVLNIDQISDVLIKQFEGRMPADKKEKERSKAKSYSVQAFKDEVRKGLERKREQEMKKQVNLTPSKLHLVLFGLHSARIDKDNAPSPSSIESVVREAGLNWKTPVGQTEVEKTYTYQEIFDLYKKFDPNKRENSKDTLSKGYFTDNEFRLVISHLKNVKQITADRAAIDDFNGVSLPQERLDKGLNLPRRQYTLAEIKQALGDGTEKREKGKDTFEMNDAMVAFVVEKLKQAMIDAKNLKSSDVDEVILGQSVELSSDKHKGPKQPVTLETIREKLRLAYEAKGAYKPKMRTPEEMDAIGERFIFTLGPKENMKHYDVRRLVVDGPGGKKEYALFVKALSTEPDQRDLTMNENITELLRRIREEFKDVLVEEKD